MMSQDPRNELSKRYRHLVVISGDDWLVLLDDLIDICMFGPQVLRSALRLATTAYTAALAKNAKETMLEIATTATDMRAMIEESFTQQESFVQSLEHLTLSWNNLTSSITNYTAEMDKKTLLLTNLGSTVKKTSVKAPSTISDFTPDKQVGTRLRISPGYSYKSKVGVLTCTVDDDLGFTANTREGMTIGKIINSIKKVKPLEIILNKDLTILSEYASKNDDIINVYPSSSVENKRSILRELNSNVPDLTDQWVKMG
ncbi:unnamed protein product [Diatraea saccharalis]|uniref:Uncharacterized protein n=1 Tax=Diatraea saccharalis TaxID=40085 RepID=A0A9N9WH66_9NEOP|nr:unnamed protein product [Diatraea saccharalis]